MSDHARRGATERALLVAQPVPGAEVLLAHAPILVCDGDGRVVWASAEGDELLGLAPGRGSLLEVVDGEDRDRVANELARLAASPHAKRRTEFGLRRADGSRRYLEADMRCVVLAGPPTTAPSGTTEPVAPTALVVLLHDMSARHDLERELYHRALHDPLTGLPNRALLDDRLEQAVARLRRAAPGEALVVCYVDIDRFKSVNDTFGHEAGDRVVREVARRLAHAVRPGDTVARVGGDEFVIVCPDTGPTALEEIASRLQATIAEPIALPAHVIEVTASIGIASAHDPATPPAQLVRDADVAMYRAKRSGRGRVFAA
jgi:diguanylate cyclase (GGDEF)-like protein